MYLLILLPDYLYMIAAKIFTFHNVSINSINGLISSVTQNSFTFHNVSINSFPISHFPNSEKKFTFHNVSINSTITIC